MIYSKLELFEQFWLKEALNQGVSLPWSWEVSPSTFLPGTVRMCIYHPFHWPTKGGSRAVWFSTFSQNGQKVKNPGRTEEWRKVVFPAQKRAESRFYMGFMSRVENHRSPPVLTFKTRKYRSGQERQLRAEHLGMPESSTLHILNTPRPGAQESTRSCRNEQKVTPPCAPPSATIGWKRGWPFCADDPNHRGLLGVYPRTIQSF